MLRRIEVEAILAHPVDRVFGLLADPTRWHEFAPAVALRRRMGDGPVEIGSRWEAIDRIGPFKVRFTDELTELVANRRVVWTSSAPWNARTTYACTADGVGTRVNAVYEGDVSGWLRLIGWVPTRVMALVLAGDFRRMRRLLAAEDRRSSGAQDQRGIHPAEAE
jgi:uncharacterized protein YndB with AHSA1/START domain